MLHFLFVKIIFFQKNLSVKHSECQNSLDTGQFRRFVGPDLGLNFCKSQPKIKVVTSSQRGNIVLLQRNELFAMQMPPLTTIDLLTGNNSFSPYASWNNDMNIAWPSKTCLPIQIICISGTPRTVYATCNRDQIIRKAFTINTGITKYV